MWYNVLVILILHHVRGHPHERHAKDNLLIILTDGVRWNYIDDRNLDLKGFHRLAEKGVKAEYVTPTFPANSYPNWYSIVTGLYAESHGMVQNYMYDQENDDYFLMTPHPNASHSHWWNRSEPLWVTAEKSGIRTAMYWWDGCQVLIRDTKPTVCHPYKEFTGWETVYDDTYKVLVDVLEDFKIGKYRLAMVYFEPVDAIGHKYGPDSKNLDESLQKLDHILDQLQDEIHHKNLEEKVNLVVVSDHGMTVSDPKKVTAISLEPHMDLNDIELMLDRGSMCMILPKSNMVEKVYRDLKNANITGLHVFKKEEVPESYHYRSNALILPIVLLADQGFFIQPISEKMFPSSSSTYLGYHGYDPNVVKDMKGIFYARGPGLKENFVSPPVEMVDHYNLFCHLLDIKPLPNNGSLAKAELLMKSKSSIAVSSFWLFFISSTFIVLYCN